MKKKSLKRILLFLLTVAMIVLQMTTAFASETIPAETEGYEVSFVTDGHAAVDIYYTQDYTSPSEENVNTAFARSSSTGMIDTSGDGQVNFMVHVEEGYELASVTANQNYKNLKDSSETGIEGLYRLTKITGKVAVTVVTQKKDTDSVINDSIVINEIESNGDITDWVEIYNKSTEAVDISGWYIMDDNNNRLNDNKTFPLPEGTILEPGGFYVFDQYINFDFGLGAPDEVNLYDSTNTLVEKYSWGEHADGVYARVPDGTGNFIETGVSTKGTVNSTETSEEPDFSDAVAWPGSDRMTTYDKDVTMFKTDSSGLDFYKGQLYCIDNKNGTFWVMDVNKDGSMDYADGFTASGKNLAFIADKNNPAASNPDTEGITVDSEGNAYAAAERDNNNKNVNYNVIMKFNPWEEGPVVTALQEWDITKLLPDVPANTGIEAVEWVSGAEVEGKLFDRNTGAPFQMEDYPNAAAAGVFFVALEYNGHVYAFVLNEDSTAQMIADINPGIGGAMALDYDSYEGILWVGADNGYGNISAQIVLNGSEAPDITLVKPPADMDVTRNNEGFAIAGAEYSVDGLRPVYHFMDGKNTGVLTISYLYCDYRQEHIHVEEVVEGKLPGCTEEGLTDGIRCSECGEWITLQEKLPAAGHTDVNEDGICDVCGEKLFEDVKYKIIEGAGSIWRKGSAEGLTIASDADIEKFKNIMIDDRVINSASYTLVPGSTRITLHAAYLETLSDGSHSIVIQSSDGAARTQFSILERAAAGNSSGPKPESTTVSSAPKTGETKDIGIWLACMISAMGVIFVCVIRKRKRL